MLVNKIPKCWLYWFFEVPGSLEIVFFIVRSLPFDGELQGIGQGIDHV